MHRRTLLKGAAAMAAVSPLIRRAAAADTPLKIGVSIPLTGAGAAVGRQAMTAIRLYMQQHGDIVAGRKIELGVHDDGGVADAASRIVQDMIATDKVDIVGIGITPTALAIAPLVTQARKVTVVIGSGASIATTESPYFVRAGFILSPQSWILAEWAAKAGSKRVVTLVDEGAPGIEAETVFTTRFEQLGGEIIQSIRIPLANPDIAPVLQHVGNLRPDTIFVDFSGTQASIFAKQAADRGLAQADVKIIGPCALSDDDDLNGRGDQMLGVITAGPYSASHDSELNKAYVAAMEQAGHVRPNCVSLGGYDGMHLIYEALKKTNGNSDGEALIAAMKGMAWESPRGPISIDPATRDVVGNIYIRRVEKQNGELWNTEFETYPSVKDPMKLRPK